VSPSTGRPCASSISGAVDCGSTLLVHGRTSLPVVRSQAPFLLDRHARLIHNLEEQAGLDRAVEHLPTEADIERCRTRGEGLTRPELAVLLAYSKNLVRAELLAANLPDDPAAVAAEYFPRAVRERFGRRIP
jgi:glutamate dehydrogenase